MNDLNPFTSPEASREYARREARNSEFRQALLIFCLAFAALAASAVAGYVIHNCQCL